MNKKIYELLNDARIDVDESAKKLSAKEKVKIMKRFEAEEKSMKRKNVKRTNIIFKSIAGISAAGVAAAAFLFVMGNKADKISTDPNSMTAQVQTTEETAAENSFFLTASAEESVSKNEDTLVLRENGGCIPYTGSTFFIRGNNIDKVELSLDKGELYEGLYKGNYKMIEYGGNDDSYGSEPIGNKYTDDNWNENRFYGLYVSEMAYSKHEAEVGEDMKEAWHRCIDDFDGAHLNITVTFKDGSKSDASYLMQAGKVGVCIDPDTNTQQPNGKMAEEGEPYFYGFILKKV